MTKLSLPLAVLLAILVGIASLSLFTVYETDKAIIERLGKLRTVDADQAMVFEPGLHFKIPFIDVVRRFNQRMNLFQIKSSRVLTAEKKDVEVDLFVKWRITDFGQFYVAHRGRMDVAERLLENNIVANVRAEFGQRTIKEVVSGERLELMQSVRDDTMKIAQRRGIEIIDVRIKRIDFPKEVRNAVFDRMRTERERVASQLRALGTAEALAIRSNAEKDKAILLAEADKTSEILRGEGDSQAAEIYAKAYNQNPEFYDFLRSLEAYKNSFKDKQDIFVLRPDSDFFKYFNQAKQNK